MSLSLANNELSHLLLEKDDTSTQVAKYKGKRSDSLPEMNT